MSLLFCLLCLPEKRQNHLAQRTLQKVVDGATLFHTNVLVGYALHQKSVLIDQLLLLLPLPENILMHIVSFRAEAPINKSKMLDKMKRLLGQKGIPKKLKAGLQSIVKQDMTHHMRDRQLTDKHVLESSRIKTFYHIPRSDILYYKERAAQQHAFDQERAAQQQAFDCNDGLVPYLPPTNDSSTINHAQDAPRPV